MIIKVVDVCPAYLQFSLSSSHLADHLCAWLAFEVLAASAQPLFYIHVCSSSGVIAGFTFFSALLLLDGLALVSLEVFSD
jgi:hypothetical protein